MATLNGETILPGCSVFDLVYGNGVVTGTTADKIHVSFGCKGRSRQYDSAGLTGKLCRRTLYFKEPAIVEFAKNECLATKQRVALEDVMTIFTKLVSGCCPDEPTDC